MPVTCRGLEALATCFFHSSTAVRDAAGGFFEALERTGEVGKDMIRELPMFWQLGRERIKRQH